MNIFNRLKQMLVSNSDGSAWNKWMSLTVVVLLISIAVTVNSLSLQKEIRQQAENSCKVINAECNNNQSGHQCCSGLQCVITNTKNGKGKCELAPTPIPTTYTPTAVPTSPPYPTSGEGAQNTPVPEITSTTETTENGVGSADPVVCGPNGCGWSPRPEGEKSTNNAPNIQVCTLNFSGPTQLIGTRLSSTSIRFNWWPAPGGADRQLIQYGLESGKPLWGLINISGDQGQIVVDHLPANSTIWAQVRAFKGNCYEDTDWIAVAIPEQIVTPTITVFPTSISMHAVSYFASTVDSGQYEFLQNIVQMFLLGFLLLLLFILIVRLILFLMKRRRKKKED